MTIEDNIQLSNVNFSPDLWPRLSATAPNQLTLAASNPVLDQNPTLFFQGNGQLKAVANLRFLTGDPATEKLVILDNGNVGIGESSPTAKLVVNGNLKLQQGLAVNEFSGDGNLTDNSDVTVPTEKAVKTYVDTKITQINTVLATKAALAGTTTQDFQTKNLTVTGTLDVTGTTTFRNIEQHQGNLELGNEDTDQVRIHGVVRSTHSSGLLQINSPINVLGNVTAAQFIGDGSGLTGLPNPWSSGGSNLAYLGGNVGIGTATPYTQLTLTGSLGFSNATTPMMYIFQSGSANPDRPIIAHSPAFPNWGLMYRDPDDKMIFQNGGTPVMTVALGAQTVGIGTATPNDKLDVAGALRVLTGANPLRFTSSWSSFPDSAANQAEICNDTGTYKTLMIVGNRSAGLGRRVSIWDRLEVNGTLISNGDIQATRSMTVGSFTMPPEPGRLVVSGPVAEVAFIDRRLTAWPSTPQAGDRFLWYTEDRVARLWTERRGEVLSVDSAGVLRAQGFVNAPSSRELKENMTALSSHEAVEALSGLNPIKFTYKADCTQEHHVGFIAEEVPDLVARPDRKSLNSMDIVAVLTKVLQEQQQTIATLTDRLNALEAQQT